MSHVPPSLNALVGEIYLFIYLFIYSADAHEAVQSIVLAWKWNAMAVLFIAPPVVGCVVRRAVGRALGSALGRAVGRAVGRTVGRAVIKFRYSSLRLTQ